MLLLSSQCSCEEDVAGGIWTLDDISHFQKVSDFLIALAYFSITLELFYLRCCTIFPFRWLLSLFAAFIVLCGLTHFVTVWTYAFNSFNLMRTLTVLKFLTAIVSSATSIILLTLIPRMLKVMIREGLLVKKTAELHREVGLMKRQREASWHVRMLTREIRRSLDRHTILYSTLVELSKLLFLENCTVWMPDNSNTTMNLTHELLRRENLISIPLDDAELLEIMRAKGVRVLGPDSKLRRITGNGAGVAIRMPMLRVSNFKSGTPEMVEERYAVLVLVLPQGHHRDWSSQELEIVEVVADQVAVALSHADVLEDSLLMREKLLEQNMSLQKARRMAVMANEARCSFQEVMSREMIRPARSIAAILSVLQLENLRTEQQRMTVDTMAKAGFLVSALIEDASGDQALGNSRIELKLRAFSLLSMLKEAAAVMKLLCASHRQSFHVQVSENLPDQVIGDETRILQALLYMVGKVSGCCGDHGSILLHVSTEAASQGSLDPNCLAWKGTICEDFAFLKFDVHRTDYRGAGLDFPLDKVHNKSGNEDNSQVCTSNVCKKLAQLMHGSLSVGLNTQEGLGGTMNLKIQLQLQQSQEVIAKRRCMDPEAPQFILKGMNTILADCDGFNQSVTRRILEKLGCQLLVVTSWHQCLEALQLNGSNYHLLFIDLGILQESRNGGFAGVRSLRLDSGLRVIALTSRSDRITRDWCLGNGIHGVICKPVILQEMEDELQRIYQ